MLQKIKSLSGSFATHCRSIAESQAKSIFAFLLACVMILTAGFFMVHKVNVSDGENTYSVITLSRDPMLAIAKVDNYDKNLCNNNALSYLCISKSQ